jgi:SOS-response transcriptional repressor LexA
MSVGSRIRTARVAKGLSPAALGKLVGVSRTTVENWEKDKHSPTKKQIPKLMNALQMRASDFNPYGAGGVSPLDPTRKLVLVPLIEWSDLKLVQAGRLNMAGVRKPRLVEAAIPDTAAMHVDDDSMEPTFRCGERIYLDPARSPQENDYVIARLESGDHLLRRYVVRRNGAFDLVAENPDFHTLTVNSTVRAEIIGVVVEHHRRLKA